MIARVRRLLTRERELRMIWELERDGRRSYLAGTAHFFPYHFKGSLRQYIGRVERVLLEGPLDEGAARRVVDCGSQRDGGLSLVDALGPRAIAKINRDLGGAAGSVGSDSMYRRLLGPDPDALDWDQLAALKPWMAFFRIWSRYLRVSGWTYTMELDALRIAVGFGKEVHFLETIEEQLEALNNVPVARIVHFLTDVDWGKTRREYVPNFLSGDLGRLMAGATECPTFCESVVHRRDPILHARMRPFFERGDTMALVGAVHCQGIKARFLEGGFSLRPPVGF